MIQEGPAQGQDNKAKYNRDSLPEKIFWYENNGKSKNNPSELCLDIVEFYDYLVWKGYRWLSLKALDLKKTLIQVKNNIVREVDIAAIRRNVFGDIDRLPNAISPNFCKKQLKRKVYDSIDKYLINSGKMDSLPEFSIPFCRDTRDSISFFFRNGFVEITATKISLKPYQHLKQPIWESQIKNHDINLYINNVCIINSEEILQSFPFSRFIKNVCTKRDPLSGNCEFDKDRYLSLLTTIGYLLHNYNDPAYAKAVIFLDSNTDVIANGGTGKSIICVAVSKLRKAAFLNGKNADFDSPFVFQEVGKDDHLVVWDDIKSNFNFESLNSAITNKYVVERKNQHRMSFSSETNPKTVISTNFVIKNSEGETYERRAKEMELFNYYNAMFTPEIEFNNERFFVWKPEEWDIFNNFMFKCCMIYLQNQARILPYVSDTRQEKKINFAFDADFVEYVKENFSSLQTERGVPQKFFYEKYLETISISKQHKSHPKGFGRNLTRFCEFRGVKLERPQFRDELTGVNEKFYRVG
jgi:hypothetical protein